MSYVRVSSIYEITRNNNSKARYETLVETIGHDHREKIDQ